MPQPTFDSTMPTDDRSRVHDIMSDMVEAAQALGRPLAGAEPRSLPPGSSLHLQGTVRMGGSDDSTCVVDLHSRVWGIENLYLGGNGLIHTRNANNPTLTSVVLALRAAAHLVGGDPRSLRIPGAADLGLC